MLNYLFVIYAFLIPISRAGIVLVTILMTILWFVDGDLKSKLNYIKKSSYIISIFIFIIFLFISILWSDATIIMGLDYIKKFWYLLPIIVISTSIKQEYIYKALYSFIISMVISLIASYGIVFELYDGRTAVSYFMKNHIMYSIFLGFTSLVLIVLSIYEDIKIKKALYIILTILFLIVLFLSSSRTGQFMFFIGLFGIMFITIKQKLKALTLFLVSFMITIILAYNYSEVFKNRINYAKSDIQQIYSGKLCNSIGGRVFTWKIAYEVFEESPILGVGSGAHLIYLKQRMDEDREFNECALKDMIDYFHGQYIEILAQGGLVGLIIFLSIFYFLWRVDLEDKKIDFIKYILIIIFLSVFLADVPFRKQFALALFALISGLILAQNRVEKEIK